jgi:hypothetical protein
MIDVTSFSCVTICAVSARKLALSPVVSESLRPAGSAGESCQTIMPSLSAQ